MITKMSKIELGSKDGKTRVNEISYEMVNALRHLNNIIDKINEIVVKINDLDRIFHG